VNLVNPHDVMYVNSDAPGESVQGKANAYPIDRPPQNETYLAEWDVPLPATRGQPLDAPGRPRAHYEYQATQDILLGQWPNEDRPPGYNILFVLVDQEHFFDKWPFPVPGREYLKANGTTFLNHQATSQVCSSARSVIYTGSAHPAYGRLRQHGGPLAADRLIPPDGTSPFCFRRLSSLSISALASGGVSGALSGSFS